MSSPAHTWSETDDANDGTSDYAGGQIWTSTDGSDPSQVRGLAAIVASNIRSELARYDLTQEDLAHMLYRSRAAISRRINGSVAWSLEDVGRIAEAMGMRPQELIERPRWPPLGFQ